MRDKVTVTVVHWLRTKALARCLHSIKEHLPDLKVLVEDTQGNCSAGRNRLYARVQTPYLLMMEDDHVVVPETRNRITRIVTTLDHHAIMGIGGTPKKGILASKKEWYFNHNFHVDGKYCRMIQSKQPMTQGIPETFWYRPCDLTATFGIFRTDLFQRVKFEERMETQEHLEFFWSASRIGKFGYWEKFRVDHLRDMERTGPYLEARIREFRHIVKEKHGFAFTMRKTGGPS